MFSSFALAVFFLGAVATPAIPAIAECPTPDGEKILELLDRAPTCSKALSLFEACSYGASGDVGLSEVVVKKCEGDFLTRLSASQRQTYYRKQKWCARKYQKESGTMYRSFEAFCSANLAKIYSQRFRKGVQQQGE
jgi:hypothetical protein